MGREIVFYRKANGHCPVTEFLDSLPSKQAQKVVWVLKLVEDLDDVPAQYFRKLVDTDELWEVRARMGPSIFRLLGFFDGARWVVLAHAFQKKTQKTPRKAIRVAEERRLDYFRRKKK